MKENKSYISCNCKTKASIYPFLLPILILFIRYFHDKLFEESKPRITYKILKYNLPYLFYLYLPKIFAIIFIPIIKFNTRSETNSENKNTILKNYHIMIENESKKKKLFLFYIISFLEVLQETTDSLLYYYQRVGGVLGWLIEKKSGYIIFVPIFCYFLLDHKFHKHHLLAIFLGIIGAIIINFIRFYYDYAHTKDYLYHLLNCLLSLIFSLVIVLVKYIMLNFLILSPYIFLFYDGIFSILNSLIIILLEYFIVINIKISDKETLKEEENDNYFKNNYVEIFTIFKGQNKKFYIYFFLSFIFSFIYYIINALTLYNFSPYLIIAIEALLPIDNDIIPYFLGEKDDDISKKLKRTAFQLIGYIIIFFAALILNEIIIFNFCGLNKNTFEIISFRGKLDSSYLNGRTLSGRSINDDNYSESDV